MRLGRSDGAAWVGGWGVGVGAGGRPVRDPDKRAHARVPQEKDTVCLRPAGPGVLLRQGKQPVWHTGSHSVHACDPVRWAPLAGRWTTRCRWTSPPSCGKWRTPLWPARAERCPVPAGHRCARRCCRLAEGGAARSLCLNPPADVLPCTSMFRASPILGPFCACFQLLCARKLQLQRSLSALHSTLPHA